MRKPRIFTIACILLLLCDSAIVMAHIYLKEWLGFFDLDKEGSIKSVFSGLQLLTNGFLASFIAYLSSRLRASRPFIALWAMISALFIYLGLDDMMMIHERVGFVLNRLSGFHGTYESFNWLWYFLPFIAIGGIAFILAVRSLAFISVKTRTYAILGLSGFVLTLLIEVIGGQLLKIGLVPLYFKSIIVEESLLLFGETFFLAALVGGATALFLKSYTARGDTIEEISTIKSLTKIPSNTVLSFFIHWSIWAVFFILIIAILFAGFTAAMPLLAHIETLFHVIFPYEAVIRFSVIWVHIVLLIGYRLWIAQRDKRHHRALWNILCFSCILLIVIFAGDWRHRLMEEFSWIRYTTSGFLIAACASSLIHAVHAWRLRLKTLAGTWVFLAGGFLFGAFDELFQFHEWIGGVIENAARLPHVATDLITVGYAFVSLIALIFFFILFRRHYREHLFSLGIFLVAGGIYFLSTLLDTLDGLATHFLKKIALSLSQNPDFIFRDWFALLWSPHNFFNGLEEVLEHTSAVLFFSAIAILLFELKHDTQKKREKRDTLSRALTQRCALISYTIGIIIMIAGIVLGQQSTISTATTNLIIARPQDGLMHADDLFYNPYWGLIIGNEGAHSVLQYKNGILKKLPDPRHIVSDTDSVTADDFAVYASSGARGAILQYTEPEGWTELWTRNDGLSFPEALVIVDNTIYVVDESKMAIIQLQTGKQPIEWKPEHPDWRTPEGIAYDSAQKKLIVTDDTTGAVFSLVFKVSIKKIARFSHAEDVYITTDGSYIISDNGTGSIYRISSDGTQEKIIQLSRSYRDVQGVASDGTHTYIVTSDGYGQGSFMPSFVLQLKQ